MRGRGWVLFLTLPASFSVQTRTLRFPALSKALTSGFNPDDLDRNLKYRNCVLFFRSPQPAPQPGSSPAVIAADWYEPDRLKKLSKYNAFFTGRPPPFPWCRRQNTGRWHLARNLRSTALGITNGDSLSRLNSSPIFFVTFGMEKRFISGLYCFVQPTMKGGLD